MVVTVCSLSCSQAQQDFKGDVPVETEIEPGLEDTVQILSATSNKPGSTNLVEVQVELRNAGGAETRLVVVGTWLDKRGNFCGSNQSVIDLPAKETHKIETGTGAQPVQRIQFRTAQYKNTRSRVRAISVGDESLKLTTENSRRTSAIRDLLG
jgi:hypothetical protein